MSRAIAGGSLRAALLSAAVLALSTAPAVGGHVFRWTDAQGHVHYGDQPPQNATVVDPKASGSAEPAAAAPATPANGAECERLSKQFYGYRAATTITETNGLGEVREYDEAQRKRLVERSEEKAHKACGGDLPPPPETTAADAAR